MPIAVVPVGDPIAAAHRAQDFRAALGYRNTRADQIRNIAQPWGKLAVIPLWTRNTSDRAADGAGTGTVGSNADTGRHEERDPARRSMSPHACNHSRGKAVIHQLALVKQCFQPDVVSCGFVGHDSTSES